MIYNKSLTCSITATDIMVLVNIGVSEAERLVPQSLSIDFQIIFSDIPNACNSDQLEDTVCYEKIINLINKFGATKKCQLLEHFGFELFGLLKNATQNTKIKLKITKQPVINSFAGNTIFEISDI